MSSGNRREKALQMKKLYNLTGTIPSTLDAIIISTKAPFIQYVQIPLDKNFRQYLEAIMVSKNILSMAVQKTSIKNHTK